MSNFDELRTILEADVPDSHLKIALTHRSYHNEAREQVEHNERYEFLGDAVLELVATEYLFAKFPNLPEGVLTSYRSALVKTESLAEEAKRLDVGKHILMSKGEDMSGGRTRLYILANTVEAIIGAMYLSLGYEQSKVFITKNILYKIEDIISNEGEIDAKTKLQEISQEEVRLTPAYALVEATGPDHNKVFKMEVKIGPHSFGAGTGKSKQEAEQNAATFAIKNWAKLKNQFLSDKGSIL
jgi:ribonuclease-3